MPKKKKTREQLDQYDFIDEDWIDHSSPDYILAIGSFLIGFSSLEHALDLHLADQINDHAHDPGYQVIELLSTRNKIDLFSRMCSLYLSWINNTESKNKKEFGAIVQKLRDLNTFRNKLVHANWMSVRRDGTVRTKVVIDDLEGTVQFERSKMTPKIINSKADEMSALLEEMEEFFERGLDYEIPSELPPKTT